MRQPGCIIFSLNSYFVSKVINVSCFSYFSADTTTKVGCPISTKKLTMTEEFLTTAEEIYAALTEQQVIKSINAGNFHFFACE